MPPNAVPHINVDLLRALPDEGPVVMLNLVRLRDRAGRQRQRLGRLSAL